jgi:ABC-type transport system involved in multi-copper enzyme maturation permease subunit
MFLTLVRKEIVGHVLSLRFGVTFILFILLVFASIYVTTNEYRRDVDESAATNRAAAAELKEIMTRQAEGKRSGDRFFEVFYGRGRTAAPPPPALSSVVQGVRPAMPAATRTNKWHSRKIARVLTRNPLAGLVPLPDLVYVVGVILSLLSILFAFDAVCGEKESGTLRLMMSNAVPRDAVLLAKWIGGYLMLLVPFLIALAGGLGYAWARDALPLTGESLRRLGMIVLLACLYISVFFTLSVAVSSLTARAPTALFLCLLIWVVWVLVIPNLAPVIAKIIEPSPSPLKIAEEKRAVRDEINLKRNRLLEASGTLRYGKEGQKEMERLDREEQRRIARLDNHLAGAVRRQNELAGVLGRLSPLASWTYAATAMAGTGPDSYRRLGRATDRLQEQMSEVADSLWQRGRGGDPKPFTLEQIPAFRLEDRPLHEAVRATLADLLILAVLNVLFFLTAFVCFLRYDVR